MVLRPTLLPLPVEPAMSRCGIAARSETTGLPVVSLPRARGSRLLASTNSAETRISRRYTVAVSGFGTSTATVPRPGIGPMMRTAAAFMARARSSERFTTWLTLTPAAGSNSYEVMTGPGLACTMCPSTPKSWSLRLSVLALASSSSRVRLSSEAGGGASRPTAGSWKAWAPPLPKSKVSCQARPLSTSVDFSLVGSFTTSGGGTAASSRSSARGHAPGGAAAARGRPAGAPARPMARAGERMRRTRTSEGARQHRIRDLRDEEHPERHEGEQDDPRPDRAYREPERLGHAPSQEAALVDPDAGDDLGSAREDARPAHQQQDEPGERGPAGREARADERRDAIERGERRKEVAGIAERPEEAAAEPGADRAHGARLGQRLPPRIIRVERHDGEAGEGQRENPLGLAHPAAGLAPGLLLRALLRAGVARRIAAGPARVVRLDRHRPLRHQ